MSKDKVRLYQLARELNVESKDLIDLLQAAGCDVRNHMSTIDTDTRQTAIDLVSGKVTLASLASAAVAAAPPKAAAAPSSSSTAQPIPAPRARRPTEIPKVKTPDRASTDGDAVSKPEEPAPSEDESAAAPSTEMPAKAPEEEEVPAAAARAEPAEVPPAETPPKAEEPPPDEVATPPTPAKASPPGRIPPPTSSRPMTMPSAPTSSATSERIRALREQRRQSRPRPSIIPAIPSAPLARTEPPRKKPEAPTQKPVMKLTSEAMRGSKFVVPDAVKAVLPVTDDVLLEEELTPKRGAGGALVGREERQKKRGQRALERRRVDTAEVDELDDQPQRRAFRSRLRKTAQQLAAARGPVVLELPITVRSFSENTGVRYTELQRRLMNLGIMASINATLSEEQAQLLGVELGIDIQVKREKTAESLLEEMISSETDDPALLVSRPPVVTFMGHVDHGKTSLMDRIRRTDVAAGEAGGITQHIGAYQVKLNDHERITFLDTPGHEAFTAMRARGANVTDIVVLVVAADDGVMPQTEEAISHAKAADVPIVVAMNKIDLPGKNIDRLRQQLSKHGLIADDWGGDTLMIGTSATTGEGIDELLEALAIVAELRELKANPAKPASGMCIEASLSEGRGVQATLLVRNGTLRRGDVVLCGTAYGRVRAMFDDRNQPLDEAGPSTPVVVSGLDLVPEAGERFVVVDDISQAREIAEQRRNRARAGAQAERQHVTLEKFYDSLKERKVQELLLVLKADVRGSIEALKKEIHDFSHDEVRVRIIHEGVGGITESDVLLADASDAIIVGFHVAPDDRALALAAEKGVEIRRYDIIYQVSEDIRKALEGMLKPESREVQLGRAVVQQVYTISRVGSVAGCRVVQGTIERSARCRVIRDGTVIGSYPIQNLKRFKEDAKEVREGMECGIKLADFDDIKREDILEAFKIEEIKRTL